VAYTSVKTGAHRDIAIDATLRAAAPYQVGRKNQADKACAVRLEFSDLRFKIKDNHIGATIVFAVDASGSMGAAKRMKETKEAILSLLMNAYQKRDKIGLVSFRGNEAKSLMDITSSADLAHKQLQQLPTGGKTPLAAGLFHAWQIIKARRLKDPDMMPMLILVTDGRVNAPLWSDNPLEDAIKAAQLIDREKINAVVIDTEKDFISLNIAKKIARAMNAAYFKAEELKSGHLRGVVDMIGDLMS
jgi:magnesium chelatase subunit D